MIAIITDIEEINFDEISKDHYGRRFRALLNAYTMEYDFCRFYKVSQGEKNAYFVVLNSAMTITSVNEIDMNEIVMFIQMHEICTIEMPRFMAEKLTFDGYELIERVLFEFKDSCFPKNMLVETNPKLDDVFNILKHGFNLDGCYDLWLTDSSHQIRHNVSKIFLYENTTATMYYNIDNIAFYGQIATSPSSRGKGYARDLLYWLENEMSNNGVTGQLFAKPNRIGFYKELGFKEIYRDIFLERKE